MFCRLHLFRLFEVEQIAGSRDILSIHLIMFLLDHSNRGRDTSCLWLLFGIIINAKCAAVLRLACFLPQTCCSSFFHRVHLYIVTGKTSKKSAQARRITVQDCHLTGVVGLQNTDSEQFRQIRPTGFYFASASAFTPRLLLSMLIRQ